MRPVRGSIRGVEVVNYGWEWREGGVLHPLMGGDREAVRLWEHNFQDDVVHFGRWIVMLRLYKYECKGLHFLISSESWDSP